MARVIRFTTSKFDVSQERANPINPIPGESLLLWLKSQAEPKAEVSEPEPEDWGWYAFAEWNGRQYMLGSSASEAEDGNREWVLQVEKQRSFRERMLGREKMGQSDECVSFFKGLLEREPAFEGVSLDPEP
jgi:hypothetical protein